MFSFAFTNVLLILALFFLLCSPGVLGTHCSPAKGPTPSSVLYPLLFPATSDSASEVTYLLLPLLLYFQALSSISLFLLISFLLLDLPCHPGSVTSTPSSSSTTNPHLPPYLPEKGLILLACKLILHGNLCLPDSVWSVCLASILYGGEHKLNRSRYTLMWHWVWLEGLQLPILMNRPSKTPGVCKASVRGQRSSTAGLRCIFCLGICFLFWHVGLLATNKEVPDPQSLAAWLLLCVTVVWCARSV